MKKFFAGLVCGMLISGATAVAASDEVRAGLFPVRLLFHLNGNNAEAGTDEAPFLNYGNRVYVPLRTFAERMGATVEYRSQQETGGAAVVEVTAVDDRDLNLRDPDGYLGVGHVSVQFRTKGDQPSVTGVFKVLKPLPQGKQAVLEIRDRRGATAAVTEYVRTTAPRTLSEMKAGEAGTFEAYFPYGSPVEDYALQLKVVDEQPWRYEQTYEGSVMDGAGGVMGYPLAMSLGLRDFEPKAGQPVRVRVYLTNLSGQSVTVAAPVSFKVRIADPNAKILASLTTAPFAGTIPMMKGSMYTEVEWDLRDANGKPVPPGEYVVSLDLPAEATGYASDEPETEQVFVLPDSLQTMRPLTIH